MARTVIFIFLTAVIFLCDAAPVDQGDHSANDKCPLMVKILDAVRGMPAATVTLKVSRQAEDKTWKEVATGVTDAKGEVHDLIGEADFSAGVYKVEFDTKSYWKAEGRIPFHEVADIDMIHRSHGTILKSCGNPQICRTFSSPVMNAQQSGVLLMSKQSGEVGLSDVLNLILISLLEMLFRGSMSPPPALLRSTVTELVKNNC
uniref:Transthyretin n=1 Tax=Lepisosteus oculatus TaxID=7918 RepID=W5MIA2_LEPOC